MLSLDIKTLSFIGLITSVMVPFVLMAVNQPGRTELATRAWTRGILLYAIGFTGMALRDKIPDLLSIVLANTILVAGYGELLFGLRLFFHHPASRRWQFISLVPLVAGFLWFTYVQPSLSGRVMISSIYLCVVCFRIAQVFRLAALSTQSSDGATAARRITRANERNNDAERRILLTLTTVFAASSLLISLRVPLSLSIEMQGTRDTLYSLSYLLGIVVNFMLAGALPMLVSRRAQSERQESENALSRVQEIAKLGAIEINLTTHTATTNAVFDEINGTPPSEKKDLSTLLAGIHPEDSERMRGLIRQVIDGELNSLNTEYRIIRPVDGVARWISAVSEVRTDAVSGERTLIATLRDITEIKQAELAAVHAMEAADAANRAKSNFLANMSHEIRTPLNGVIGMAQLLEHTEQSAEQHEYTRTIVKSAQSLLTIVNDILDFSKVEAGQLAIDPMPFQPQQLIADLHAAFTPQAQVNGNQFSVDVSPELPRHLIGDAGRLRQILSNLLSNATKFTRNGSITLTVSSTPIATVNGESERVGLCYEVSDTGMGMSAETLAGLFSPFYQADASITRRFGGTGLGLSICQRLAHLMGGDIRAESTLGQGSRFILTLPFARDPAPKEVSAKPVVIASTSSIDRAIDRSMERAEAAVPTSSPSSSAVPQRLTLGDSTDAPPHILVVDDNTTNQIVAQRMLTRMGVVSTIANDGREALRLLGEHRFQAVLMDCQMPVMDGYEATRHIRAGAAGSHNVKLPIIAITANAMTGDRELCLDAGMNDFIAKPLVFDVLRRTLEQWLTPAVSDDPGTTERTTKGTTVVPPSAATKKTAPQFDEKTLLGLAMNDRELAIELVTTALEDLHRHHHELEQSLAENDLSTAKRHAHTLKSLCAQCGGLRLSERYTALENALIDAIKNPANSSETAPLANLASLRQDYDDLLASLRAWQIQP